MWEAWQPVREALEEVDEQLNAYRKELEGIAEWKMHAQKKFNEWKEVLKTILKKRGGLHKTFTDRFGREAVETMVNDEIRDTKHGDLFFKLFKTLEQNPNIMKETEKRIEEKELKEEIEAHKKGEGAKDQRLKDIQDYIWELENAASNELKIESGQ